jgi:hypothetical protein
MKRNLVIISAFVFVVAIGVGVVVLIQAMRPEGDERKTIKPNTEPIALLPKKEEKKSRPVEPPEPEKKVDIKPKQEEDPPAKKDPEKKTPVEPESKKEIKKEPVIEPKKEDAKQTTRVIAIGNDIKLNDADGAYTLKPINAGERVVVQGKIKTLTIAGLNEKSTLDTTLLVADEIAFAGNLNGGATAQLGKTNTLTVRDINDKSTLDASACAARSIILAGAVNGGSTVKLHAPGGVIEFQGGVNDHARIEIVAPDGKVLFKGRGNSAINGNAQLGIVAKDVELRGAVNGDQTRLDITLTRGGVLQFNRLNGSAKLHYRKASAGDPEPIVSPGTVSTRAEFRNAAPKGK